MNSSVASASSSPGRTRLGDLERVLRAAPLIERRINGDAVDPLAQGAHQL